MFKLRSVFLVLLMAMILPYQGIALVAAAPPAIQPVATGKNFVSFFINEVKILGDVGDISGQGELRLIISMADKTGRSTNIYCPGDAPTKIRKGQTIYAPCVPWVSFDEATISDGVYIMVIAVDEDKSSLPVDLSYDMVSSQLGNAFGKAIKQGVIKLGLSALAKSNPFTFGVELLFGLVSGKVKEWVEQADIIGSQGIYLSIKDGWSADDNGKTVKSNDGGIQITYTTMRLSSASPDPKAPILGQTTPVPVPTIRIATPTASVFNRVVTPTQTPAKLAPQYQCDDLSYVKLKVGDRAKVVWHLKVNLRTAPVVPKNNYYSNSIAQLEPGTPINIIGGPACAHNGTWWQVRLQNGQTGWMREHKSDGYLIGK